MLGGRTTPPLPLPPPLPCPLPAHAWGGEAKGGAGKRRRSFWNIASREVSVVLDPIESDAMGWDFMGCISRYLLSMSPRECRILLEEGYRCPCVWRMGTRGRERDRVLGHHLTLSTYPSRWPPIYPAFVTVTKTLSIADWIGIYIYPPRFRSSLQKDNCHDARPPLRILSCTRLRLRPTILNRGVRKYRRWIEVLP